MMALPDWSIKVPAFCSVSEALELFLSANCIRMSVVTGSIQSVAVVLT